MRIVCLSPPHRLLVVLANDLINGLRIAVTQHGSIDHLTCVQPLHTRILRVPVQARVWIEAIEQRPVHVLHVIHRDVRRPRWPSKPLLLSAMALFRRSRSQVSDGRTFTKRVVGAQISVFQVPVDTCFVVRVSGDEPSAAAVRRVPVGWKHESR